MSEQSTTRGASAPDTPAAANFVREMVRSELADGTHARVQTRFPPEPNGYL
ncbi:MAG: hypothetical protein ACKO27_12555, partial [Ilumatobacteraceae bacterium]